jgi:hypothetical protein
MTRFICFGVCVCVLGEEYIPFHEMPELKNIVLTGREDHENAIGL